MTTPSKFDMGGIPKTKTGLVPASFRRKMEDLSATTHWSQLPAKPKPPMYPYRGDYVNERNRKLQHDKKLVQKQTRRLVEASKSRESDRSGSTQRVISSSGNTLSTPLFGIVGQGIPPYNVSKEWDSYCKHISFHKLSDDEQRARARNKNEFVSYLRSSAAKRSETKGKEVQQVVAETIVRQRKPPVPRLSRLARSSEDKENLQHGACTHKGGQMKTSEKESSPKAGYLDFISKKVDESPKQPIESKVTTAARITPNFAADEDDDSKFRSQIQRIVERAAEMVLKDQHKGHNDLTSLDKGNATNTKKTSSKVSRVGLCIDDKTTSDVRRKTKFVRNVAARDAEFFRRQNEQVSILEEQAKSMSSSVVSETDWFSSSSYTTSVGPSRDGDLMIDMMPKVQRRPMTNSLHGIDSDSCATSHLTDSESTSINISGGAISCSIGRLSVEEENSALNSATSWNGIETLRVKIQPHDAFERRHSIDACPEETSPPQMNPTIEPPRMSREEEPLPRGYEHTLLTRRNHGVTCESTFTGDFMHPGTVDEARCQNEIQESFIDDIFSLFV